MMNENSNFQFILPYKTSDLLNSSGDNYFVKEIYRPSELEQKLLECKSGYSSGELFYIFEHFDTFYSVCENTNQDERAIRCLLRSFDLLYLTVDKLGSELMVLLNCSEPLEQVERVKYLNLTKMTLFLLVHNVRRLDAACQNAMESQQSQQTQQKKGAGGRARPPEIIFGSGIPDWSAKRGRFLVQLFNIMQCPLEKLWFPPVIEETFVTLLCDICYRTLEMSQPRAEKHNVLTVFQIFGTAIKRYDHAMTFPVRIIQILRNTEHAAAAIATGIILLHEEYGISTIFAVLIKDIIEILAVESADNVISRNFSNFLTEFAGLSPKLVIPHLSKISDELLDCESHVLRNCVLQIMCDAIVGELTAEELSEELKEARNEFLEMLLAHVNDISAHVRVKVLHIWQHLKEQHAIPLSFLLKVLREAVCRLDDKTSTVRKSAIQLIKAFLERNPFAGKLTLEELIKKHEAEVEQMHKIGEQLDEERKKLEQFEEEWEQRVPEIVALIEESLSKHESNEFETEESYEALVEKITPLLLAQNFKDAITLARKADNAAGNDGLRSLLEREEQCLYYMSLLKTFASLANGCKDINEVMQKQIKTVQFLEDSIEFSNVITKAMPKMRELLMSKTNSDVFEAVDLFTTGFLFGIKGTQSGMQQMLYLVWTSDKEKRDAVSNAYRQVLFKTDASGRAHAIKVVQNLCNFLEGLEYGHYTAMESLMHEWISTEDVDAVIIQVLFERFTLKLEGTTNNESRLALQLLIMASQQKSAIASANINVIETIGLGERGRRDPRIFTGCLDLLVNSIDASDVSKFYKRYTQDHPLVQKIINMFLAFLFHPQLPDFDHLAKSVMEFVYKLCQAPDLIAQQIVTELFTKFNDRWLQNFEEETDSVPASQATAAGEDIPYSQPLTQTQGNADGPHYALPAYLMARFIFTVGYLILKEMIFLDMDVYNNVKYREELTVIEEKKKKSKNVPNNLLRRTMLNMSATQVHKRLSSVAAEPQQEPDEDLVGATAEDAIAEEINLILEQILLYGENALFSKLAPVIVEICKKPGQYRNDNLQQAATLALARLMTVSSKFCEANTSFLMNILNLTKNIKIKCNIVVTLSDLTFRFPNVIEPWKGHFYTTLHETNTELRLTAVKMLSHLILHDMLRVKGQIADLALCIVDPNDEIKNITQQFFKEIATHSNSLYNAVPDIISKLSDVNLRLQEEKFHIIMRHIMSLIQKDRHIEGLVEKLCHRFPESIDERQWRDIAYCLSLLSYNERSIKKLIDNVDKFKDKVQVDEVYQSFKLIISNSSKLAKPELKTLVTELETRINECLEVREPGSTADKPPAASQEAPVKTKRQPKGKAPKNVPRQQSKRTRRLAESSEEESASSDEAPPARSGKQKAGRKNNSSFESDPPTPRHVDATPAAARQGRNSSRRSTTTKRR